MKKSEWLESEIEGLKKRLSNANRIQATNTGTFADGLYRHGQRIAEQDAALVEVAGVAADNAVTNEEIMSAIVELADIVAGAEPAGGE